jgi:hypothetical protein
MFSTLDWAVKGASGLSRSTILNETECGQPTAANDSFGDWKIDYREFHPIYPSPAANAHTDGTQVSVTPDVPTLEAEIAALVQEAQQSLRQSEVECWDTGQNLQGRAADSNNVGRFSATIPKNIEVKVNKPSLERRAWDPDIRVNDPVRALEAVSSRDAQSSRAILAVLLGTSLAIGWIVRLPPFFVESHLPIPTIERQIHPSAEVPDSDSRVTLGSPETNREATPRPGSASKIALPVASIPGHRRDSPNSAPQQSKAVKTSLVAQRRAGPSEPAASGFGRRPDVLPRSIPFPETKPTTVDGWTVRDVLGGTAILEGPDGIWRAARGDSVPGLGRLESIVRWGSRWIVVTDKGLVSTP